MTLESIARLEKLVDRLLAERIEQQDRNRELTAECERLTMTAPGLVASLINCWVNWKVWEGKLNETERPGFHSRSAV